VNIIIILLYPLTFLHTWRFADEASVSVKILIFAGSFYPFFGGYENFIYNLSTNLIKKGFSVDLLTTNTERCVMMENLDGIRIYRLDCWNALNRTFPIPKPNLKSFKMFYSLLRKDYDVVNTHTRFFITSFIGAIFAIVKRIPLVHVEHGSTHSVLKNKFVSIINILYDHLVGGLIVNIAYKNVGISNSSCNFLKHIGAKEPILISDGIDLDFFKKVDTGIREKLDLTNYAIITFIGRLIYAKGAQDLIAIFPKIKKKNPNTKVIIVGDGPYKNELQKMIDKEYKNDILFLGTKTPREIVGILNITDIFINLSYSEGFGITILEAGAVGVPIIATEVGGVPELIKDYETGIIINPGDREHLYSAIVELIDNSDLRKKLSGNIRLHVKNNYNWDVIIMRYIQLFRGCIK
jgi:glycosyltransferase involved in cell wall biosynthesis